MMRYLMHASRFSFLLYLLVALHTSCTNSPRSLGFNGGNNGLSRGRSKSMPDLFEIEKIKLSEIVENGLAYRGRGSVDPYDQESFRRSMQLVIEGRTFAQGGEYKYIKQIEPILLVAIHYSKDAELVNYLLQKDAHQDLSKEEIHECLKAAVTNPVLEEHGNMKKVLQLLIKAFKTSSEHFPGEVGSLDTLLTRCPPSSIHHFITTLDEEEIDVFGAGDEGNTLPHRLCKRYLLSLESVSEWHEELLAFPKAQACLEQKNKEGKTPAELYPKMSLEAIKKALEEGEKVLVNLAEYKDEEKDKLLEFFYNHSDNFSLRWGA